MNMGATQIQKQVMKLAPKMIQSMEILQLPLQALQERIEQEMVENPLLELQEKDPTLPDEKVEREDPNKQDESERELVVSDEDSNADDFERLDNLDKELPESFEERPRTSSDRMQQDADRQHDALANLVGRPESLHDHLLNQLGELEDLPADLEKMAERIISMLAPEDGGYLRTSLNDMLPAGASEEQLALAESALELVQSFEPAGIAARSLSECLLLQLTPETPHYEALTVLISSHLEDLRDNRLPQIERKTGISIDTIQEAWQELRKLNPKPASGFMDVHVATVTPDVLVEQDADGAYHVKLEDEREPSLFISGYYRKRLESGQATNEEKEYIRKKIESAKWLIEAIEQRRSTLTRVSQAIVDHQTRFLDDGPEYIEPLKMQQIADKVGVHVTTVSRAVDDKWIQTPRGILPLKRFFAGGTKNEEGGDVAWDTIRIKLQDLIDHEDKKHPYSDYELVQQLKESGFNVARRTITKYRQKMGIPSSRQRRAWTS